MARRKLEDKNTRKIFRSGKSYCVTLPVEIMREFKWHEKQKVIIKKSGNKMTIEDWKK